MRSPALTAVAVTTLAVGIGGAPAIFSIADAVVLRPLPSQDPDRLFVVWQSDHDRNQPFLEVSYPAFREWRSRSRLFPVARGDAGRQQRGCLDRTG